MMFTLTVESSPPLRYTLPLRQWLPLHAGASGLAILAYLPDEVQTEVARGPLSAATDRTIVDPESLLQRLAMIREDGYSITHGERIEGAIAIASPVFGPTGAVLGVTGMTIPATRFNAAHSSTLAGLVRQAAEQLTAQLSGTRDLRASVARH